MFLLSHDVDRVGELESRQGYCSLVWDQVRTVRLQQGCSSIKKQQV